MQRHKTGSLKKPRLDDDNKVDFVDPFNAWEDPLGMGHLNSSKVEQEIGQLVEENALGEDAAQAPHQEDSFVRLKAEMEELRLRSAAEMENFKKRLKREHDEQIRYAAEKVLADILPALDNLDLALQYVGRNDACNDLLQGISMTRKLLLEAVARHGLAPFGEEGDVFTPEVHEAVGVEKRDGLAEGSISRVLQSGYKLGDRVLRPAKVLIHQ